LAKEDRIFVSGKNYVYPKLAKKDFWLFAIQRRGLANLLYVYARALIYAKKNDLEIIWPTWFSIQKNRIIGFKKDKRSYHDLFVNRSGHIGGLKKLVLLATKRKVLVRQEIQGNLDDYSNTIFCFWRFYGDPFEGIRNDSRILYDDLRRNLHKKNLKVFSYDYENKIGIHVRLDDFKVNASSEISSEENVRTPIQWYVNTISKIRKVVSRDIPIEVYSDGIDEELVEILRMSNARRHTFGTAIADIFALSQYKLVVGSGSTFSVMARYLGRNDSISPIGQIREHLLTADDESREIELGMNAEIPDFFKHRIAKIYGKKMNSRF
jgi:hypothetical protein